MDKRIVLKKWLRSTFEESAIGRVLAADCASLYSPDFNQISVRAPFYNASGGLDEFNTPFFEHQVLPAPKKSIGCYYAVGGMKRTEKSSLSIYLGPTRIDIGDRSRYFPYGTDKDYIQLNFYIHAADPQIVECTRMVKFDCNAVSPVEAGKDADRFFAETDSLVADMNKGRLVDFMRMKRQTLEHYALGLQGGSEGAFMAFENAEMLPDTVYGDRIEQRRVTNSEGRKYTYDCKRSPVLKRDGMYLS